MQQQSNEQNKFLIDADIGDDDVTLPSLPVVNVPIVETKEQTVVSSVVVAETSAEEADTSVKGGFFSRMKEGLTKTRKNLADGMVNILIGGKEIDDELLEEVEEQLLVADIGVDATKTIIANLTERTARGDLIYSHSLYKALQEELVALLAPRVKSLHIDPNKTPYVILVVGVNGVGKTTTIGKLAYQFKKAGRAVYLGAADTFRAAAVEQLHIWGERVGVPVIKQKMGSDPASVAFDTLSSAVANNADVVIIDTAGRLHNKVGLMNELTKIKNVMKKVVADAPHEVLLVLDGSTGQNAFEQAKQFTLATEVTAMAITKLDGTAKGGVVIGISEQFKIPVKYIGLGEGIEDMQVFRKKEFVDSLFGETE